MAKIPESVSASINLDRAEKILRDAILAGLSSRKLKASVENLALSQIEKTVNNNQDLFRPDRGPEGGDDLVGFLGIGQSSTGSQAGRPSTQKYAGEDAAWTLLRPIKGKGIAALSSSFRKARAGNFGRITYTINLDSFFNNFRSTYISRKRGDSDFQISWMQNLIDGVPTEQTREYPDGETEFAFVTGGPDFNPNFSRTGLGHMVPVGKLKIPAQQFTFRGRGRANTFGKLLAEIGKSLRSAAFKNKIAKSIRNSIVEG